MKDIILTVVILVDLTIASYYVGHGLAKAGKAIEGIFIQIPEKKYGW